MCKNYGYTPILQALATVPLLVTEPGSGSSTGDRAHGTGLHWWFRYGYRCEIQFRSGPTHYVGQQSQLLFKKKLKNTCCRLSRRCDVLSSNSCFKKILSKSFMTRHVGGIASRF